MNSSILRCRKPISRLAAGLLSTLFPLILLSAHAQIVVNSTGDGSNGYPPGFGSCDTNAFDNVIVCTLRAAIEVANGNPNASTITFNIPTTDPGYNAQTHSWTIRIPPSSPLPNLSTDINIAGPGAAKLRVASGGMLPNTPHLFSLTTPGTVSFSGITIGQVDEFGEVSPGGIKNWNTGTVNITNCIIRDNVIERESGCGEELVGALGAGIYNISGTVNVISSTLSGNSVLGYSSEGGGIYNGSGTVNLMSSRIINNTAGVITERNSFVVGGGIYNRSGTVNIRNSELSGNSATSGGAVFNSGLLNVTNCTFFGNSAVVRSTGSNRVGGGAIFNSFSSTGNVATANVSNSTISGNTALGVATSTAGGGIFNFGGAGGAVNVRNTVIAGNNSAGLGPDVYSVFGGFSSKGFNLIGKKDGSTGFNAATDLKGTIKVPLDPKLGPLQNNGGPTQTIALLTGSPAIDKGTSVSLAGPLTTDQRGTGFSRVHDNGAIANAAGGNGTDIGAFELQTP